MTDLPATVFLVELIKRTVAVIHGIHAELFAVVFYRAHGFAFAAMAGGQIQRNAIYPSIERAVAFKRIQLEKGLRKGLLYDIAGVLDVAGHVHDGIVEPVLIFEDQLSKGCRMACQCFGDQLGVVAHVRLAILDATAYPGVPRDWTGGAGYSRTPLPLRERAGVRAIFLSIIKPSLFGNEFT